MRDREVAVRINVLIRVGAHGSTLTKQAHALLGVYSSLSERLEEEARSAYRELI